MGRYIKEVILFGEKFKTVIPLPNSSFYWIGGIGFLGLLSNWWRLEKLTRVLLLSFYIGFFWFLFLGIFFLEHPWLPPHIVRRIAGIPGFAVMIGWVLLAYHLWNFRAGKLKVLTLALPVIFLYLLGNNSFSWLENRFEQISIRIQGDYPHISLLNPRLTKGFINTVKEKVPRESRYFSEVNLSHVLPAYHNIYPIYTSLHHGANISNKAERNSDVMGALSPASSVNDTIRLMKKWKAEYLILSSLSLRARFGVFPYKLLDVDSPFDLLYTQRLMFPEYEDQLFLFHLKK